MLVLGRDTEHAMHNMALLEKVALDYLLTLLAGEKVAGIPLPIREIAFNKLRGDEKKLAAQEAEAAAEAVAADRVAADAATAAAAAPSDAAAAPSDAAADAAATAEAKAGGAASSAEPATGASAPPADQKYAISEYPDVAAVYAGLENLVSRPLRVVSRRSCRSISTTSTTQCARSQGAHRARPTSYIPGGVQHNLAFNYPFPIAIEKADGAYLWDADGNRYIDFLQAGGPTVLGSNYAAGAREGHRGAQRVRAR